MAEEKSPYAPATQIYEELKGLSNLHKAAADTLIQIPKGASPLSPDELISKLEPLKTMSRQGLQKIVEEARTQKNSPAVTKPEPTRMDYLVRLAATFAGVALLYLI